MDGPALKPPALLLFIVLLPNPPKVCRVGLPNGLPGVDKAPAPVPAPALPNNPGADPGADPGAELGAAPNDVAGLPKPEIDVLADKLLPN